jgi:hypothetical protein
VKSWCHRATLHGSPDQPTAPTCWSVCRSKRITDSRPVRAPGEAVYCQQGNDGFTTAGTTPQLWLSKHDTLVLIRRASSWALKRVLLLIHDPARTQSLAPTRSLFLVRPGHKACANEIADKDSRAETPDSRSILSLELSVVTICYNLETCRLRVIVNDRFFRHCNALQAASVVVQVRSFSGSRRASVDQPSREIPWQRVSLDAIQ